MIIVGLTGSIGMGKTTTAAMFAQAGLPVFDADATVHGLYSGEAVEVIEAVFPGTVQAGTVDRIALSARVLGNPGEMARLEAIIHPLVADAERRFVTAAAQSGHLLALLDIPLLLESNRNNRAHVVVVVSATSEIQRQRVMQRADMTEEKFRAIVDRQMPDAEKCRKAHFIVDSGRGFESARKQVTDIIRACRAMVGTA